MSLSLNLPTKVVHEGKLERECTWCHKWFTPRPMVAYTIPVSAFDWLEEPIDVLDCAPDLCEDCKTVYQIEVVPYLDDDKETFKEGDG